MGFLGGFIYHDLLGTLYGDLDEVLPDLDDVELSDGVDDPVLHVLVGDDGDRGC